MNNQNDIKKLELMSVWRKLSPWNKFLVLWYAHIVVYKQQTNSMVIELVRRLFRWLSK